MNAANTVTMTLAQLDELQTLQSCLSVVADLMIPCNNLSTVDRDDLACLLSYLTSRQLEVMKGAA